MARGRLYIVGAGPGTTELLTPEARRIMSACRYMAAGRNLLPLAASVSPGALTHTITAKLEDLAAFIEQHLAAADVCVLTSGDPGCFSILPYLKKRFPDEVIVSPGISSVQLMAARLGIPWDAWRVVSLHGRDIQDLLIDQRDANESTIFLCDGSNTPQAIAARLLTPAQTVTDQVRAAAVGEHLGRARERIVRGSLEELVRGDFSSDAVLLVLAEDHMHGETVTATKRQTPFPERGWAPGIPDELWMRAEGVPLSKSEVRAVLLSRAQPVARSVIWDVGAGTGSYGIECALLEPRAQVIAIDSNPAACHLIAANARRFGARVEVVCGEAPLVFEGLAGPDLVIIGGSRGMLEPIFKAAHASLRPGGRLVVTALLDATRKKAHRLFAASGLVNRAGVKVSIARGESHEWLEQNPVIIFGGDRQPAAGAQSDGKQAGVNGHSGDDDQPRDASKADA